MGGKNENEFISTTEKKKVHLASQRHNNDKGKKKLKKQLIKK